MKNKYLFLALIFPLTLLTFLFSPQSSFAASVWTSNVGVSVGQTIAYASTTVLNCNPDQYCGGVGIVWGTASGVYTATSSSFVINTFTTSTVFTATTTNNLSRGTLYYAKSYASSTGGTVYSTNEITFLTGVADPASLANTDVRTDSMALSWTTGTGSEKTMLRYSSTAYPSSISDGSQAFWGTGGNETIYNLSDNTTYYFRAWSSTSDGGYTTSSESYAELAATTKKIASSRTVLTPLTYSDSLVINQGAATTNSREVNLILKAGSVENMTICNRSDFVGCWLEAYSATKSWVLAEGDGIKTVYAKFVSGDGINSEIVSDTITLKTEVQAAPAAPAITATPEIPAIPAVPATQVAPAEKPIAQMTKQELTAKIAEVLAQVKQLQAQLDELKSAGQAVVGVPSEFSFTKSLQAGNRSNDVKYLQLVLISQGLLEDGSDTGWFGPLTKTAVINFQEKYAVKVLTPSGLVQGTGFVGSATRAKLNEILGK